MKNNNSQAEEIRAMLNYPIGWKIIHDKTRGVCFLRNGTVRLYWEGTKLFMVEVFNPSCHHSRSIPKITTRWHDDPNKALYVAYKEATMLQKHADTLVAALENAGM